MDKDEALKELAGRLELHREAVRMDKPNTSQNVCMYCSEVYNDEDGETCSDCGHEHCPSCVPYNSSTHDQYCPDCRPTGWTPDSNEERDKP